MHDESNILYFKGNLVFNEEPDWALLVKAIEVHHRMRRSYHGRPLEFRRATVDADGAILLPFISEGHLQLSRREGAKRIELTREEAIEEFFADMLDELGSFFGCGVDFEPLEPDFAHPDDLEAVTDMFEGGRPRGMFGREPLEADDLRPDAAADPTGEALAELDALIGLDSVKGQIHDIVSLVRNHGRDKLPCLHMVFRGNPGTGKTTAARLIARIFDEEGVTDGKGTFVETDRSGLCGMFVGHTASRTKRVIEEAQGGVLFIDEAYALGMSESGVDYGPEALATLVKAMEDKRGDFVCILAGYPEPMDRMIDVNPGLRDRIAFYIDFPDYSAAELACMFGSFAREDGFRLSTKAANAVSAAMRMLVVNKDGRFSNGRIVRKAYERVRMAHMVSSSSSVIGVAAVEKAFANDDLAKLVSVSTHVDTGFC